MARTLVNLADLGYIPVLQTRKGTSGKNLQNVVRVMKPADYVLKPGERFA